MNIEDAYLFREVRLPSKHSKSFDIEEISFSIMLRLMLYKLLGLHKAGCALRPGTTRQLVVRLSPRASKVCEI